MFVEASRISTRENFVIMAEVTASAVKQLREKTGAGMMECKNALVEAGGNDEVAVDILRKRGLASAKNVKAGLRPKESSASTYTWGQGWRPGRGELRNRFRRAQ
jgi:hypothetical protein